MELTGKQRTAVLLLAMNPGRTEILISSLADQAVEMLKTEAANRNIAIVRQYDAHVPVILSDPAQLEQIFINVIDNAIDAMARSVIINSGQCFPISISPSKPSSAQYN